MFRFLKSLLASSKIIRLFEGLSMSAQIVSTPSKKPSSNTMTWNDLNFWKTSRWETIQKILLAHKESVTPPMNRIFRPFIETPLRSVRVCFVFPEPYYTEGVADGLALSHSQAKNPYLFDAFLAELKADYSVKCKRTDLKHWARRGVLLWNARPTTLVGHTKGHAGIGWEVLTTEVLETVYLVNPNTVFVLVGEEVVSKYRSILPDDATVLMLPFPMPKFFRDDPKKSDGFEGCRVFSQINTLLGGSYRNKILWET